MLQDERAAIADANADTADTPTGTIPKQRDEPRPSPEAAHFFSRAQAALKLGDVASARALFEAAGADPNAEHGLAETWDPDVLARMGVIGTQGDRGKADKLYDEASRDGWKEESADR